MPKFASITASRAGGTVAPRAALAIATLTFQAGLIVAWSYRRRRDQLVTTCHQRELEIADLRAEIKYLRRERRRQAERQKPCVGALMIAAKSQMKCARLQYLNPSANEAQEK